MQDLRDFRVAGACVVNATQCERGRPDPLRSRVISAIGSRTGAVGALVVRALECLLSVSGRDGGEQRERLGAGGAGLGVVDDERLAVGIRDRELFEAEL